MSVTPVARVVSATLASVGARIAPGITTAQIDAWVREDTARRGGKPSQLGYQGFPAAVCTSKNEVVCHGIPRRDVVLEEGDIVNVDVTTLLGGFHGDCSKTFFVGAPSEGARRVVEVAKSEGCSVVTDFGGHGIRRKMHQDPHVSHAGARGTGLRLRAGMAFTIEPMINIGRPAVRVLADGWTVVTADGSLSAQFEHTILVTADGVEILTES